jgi:hypothetical protein
MSCSNVAIMIRPSSRVAGRVDYYEKSNKPVPLVQSSWIDCCCQEVEVGRLFVQKFPSGSASLGWGPRTNTSHEAVMIDG